jgi:outer membrane protein assembly factor BamC
VQYWIRNSLAVAVVLSLGGCSVFTNDAHHERNYRANDVIAVPAHLNKPQRDPKYAMDVAQYDVAKGSELVRSPAQVITLAEGSWVNEGDKLARVFFDKNEGISNLPEFIYSTIDDLLAEYNIKATEKVAGKVVTDWYSVLAPVDVWWWEEEREVSRQRFEFIVETQEHKRTSSVTAKLLDYQSEEVALTPLLQQRLEAYAVNAFVEQFDFNYRKLVNELNKQKGIISLTMGFDDKGNAALVTEQNIDSVFDRFPTFLERVGFIIDEIDQDRKLIFATYTAPEQSVWDTLWSDNVNQLPLEEGQYQMLVSKTADGGTAITWLDQEGETLEPGTLNDLLQSIVKLLRERGVNI